MQANQKLHTIQQFLAGVITCPKCEHEFTLDGGKIVYTQQQADEMSALLKQADVQIKKLQSELVEQQNDLNLIEQGEAENARVRRKLQGVENTIKSLSSELTAMPAYKLACRTMREQVLARQYDNVLSGLRKRIDESQDELTQSNSQLEAILAELEQTKRWIVNYEDFRFFLGNKPVEAICVLANQYLQLNGSDLNLFIEGFKKLRSGELRQALEPVIYRNWTNPQSFHQFSEGEKVRLNLAVDLAFQQLINESSKWGGLDLYINDELINPLDSAGVANAAKAFDQLGKTIMLVTHSGADMVYDNTIVIQKKDGRSTI
jgi:DNA repair exonuclease SbcCD ATPase subunit